LAGVRSLLGAASVRYQRSNANFVFRRRRAVAGTALLAEVYRSRASVASTNRVKIFVIVQSLRERSRSLERDVSFLANTVHEKQRQSEGGLQHRLLVRLISDGLEAGEGAGSFASVYRRCIQGLGEIQQIRIAAAERHYTEALQLAEQHVGPNSVAAALPASLISQIRNEQGRLEEAEIMLIDRLSFISAGAMLDCVLSAYLVMVRVAASRMNHERAYTLLERAENIGTTRGWGRLAAAAVAERARLYVTEGRLNEAAACLERIERLSTTYPALISYTWLDIDWYAKLTRAYLAFAQKGFDNAIEILMSLRRDSGNAHNNYFALRVATQLCAVRFSAGQVTEALSEFGDILSLSAQAGIHQTIMDEGLGIGALLIAFQQHAERTRRFHDLMPFVDELIAGWRSRYKSDARPITRSTLTEPLSAREHEILRLISQGQSNKEIARTLAIGPETVKSHVKRIFIKLGVERRAQAVSRSQSLGLVSTY